MDDYCKIALWPDDSWCLIEDVGQYMVDAGLSDDYETVKALIDQEGTIIEVSR